MARKKNFNTLQEEHFAYNNKSGERFNYLSDFPIYQKPN